MPILIMAMLVGVNSMMACISFKTYAGTGNPMALVFFILNSTTAAWCLVQAVRMDK